MRASLCVELRDEAASIRFGDALARSLPPSATIFMHGDLGAGKTTIVRAVLRALGYSGPVPSPTYTLAEIYSVASLEVQHFDLYRLADPEEFEFIGGRDYFALPALRFVEWPERGLGVLPQPDVELRLHVSGTGRRADLCTFAPAFSSITQKLDANLIR